MFVRSLPWDQNTLGGYCAEICLGLLGSECYLIATGLLILLYISMCLNHRAFYHIFKHSICVLNSFEQNRNDMELLGEIIHFHNLVKQWVYHGLGTVCMVDKSNFQLRIGFRWFLDSANVYSPFIMAQMFMSMIMLTCVIFQIDLILWNSVIALTNFSI